MRLTRIVRILVESGLIYTGSVVIFFGTFLAANNAEYAISNCVRASLLYLQISLLLIQLV